MLVSLCVLYVVWRIDLFELCVSVCLCVCVLVCVCVHMRTSISYNDGVSFLFPTKLKTINNRKCVGESSLFILCDLCGKKGFTMYQHLVHWCQNSGTSNP
jgi:hypothetical protein